MAFIAIGLHESLLCAFGADDLVCVSDETAPDQAGRAACALEAIVVPVAVLEGDEPCAADAGDWLRAGRAALGEEFAEALSAAGLVITTRETLAS